MVGWSSCGDHDVWAIAMGGGFEPSISGDMPNITVDCSGDAENICWCSSLDSVYETCIFTVISNVYSEGTVDGASIRDDNI